MLSPQGDWRLCVPRLNQSHQQLLRDHEELASDHKQLKTQLNAAKLDQARLEGDFSRLREQYLQLDITSTKLTNQCEVGPQEHPSRFVLTLNAI